jgi:outer membrane protein insertion porin family
VTSAGSLRRFSLSIALATLLVALGAAVSAQERTVLVRDVGVEGNRRVQEAVILGRVQTKIGTAFNPSAVSEDVRSIFALGFFDDVRVKVDDFEGGVRVIFVVAERPFVRDVDFVGNKRFDATTLQEKIDLRLGSVYNPVEVQRAREKLLEAYEEEGYFEAQITPEVERFPDGDVKIVFTINDGRRITIDHIEVLGNKGLTDSQIKDAMATQERQYFILRGLLQRQKLDEDVERILSLYNDNGYIQARVDSTEVKVDREKGRVVIVITVVEGPQYKVEEVRITGVTLVPESEVRRLVKLKPGDVFSRGKLRESLRQITDLYSNIGRASVEITPRTDQQAETATVVVSLDLVEGPEVYVERINVSGNLRSQDKILRREIPMHEGELFTLQKMERARQRLLNLGYFETVNVATAPGSDKTKIIVNVEVTEKPTGLFSLGGGFSSVDSFVGTIDFAQRNFLGRGWEVTVRLRGGASTQQGVVSFTEPWLFDRPLSAGFDLFSVRRVFDQYDYDSLGGGLRLSHPFEEYWRWHLGYRITRDDTSNPSNDAVKTALGSALGTLVTSLVSGAITRDSRDSAISPTRGTQVNLLLDVAGLGGDSRYVKGLASINRFMPAWFDHIFSWRAEAGYGFGWGGEDLPLFERFYLGGPNSIRSFKFRKISPEKNGVLIGGTTELLGNVEYIIPLPFNIRLAGFIDVGNVYGLGTKFDPTDLREAIGGGIRWLSPFGPIRVDYGINPTPRKGDDFGALQFSVGSPF